MIDDKRLSELVEDYLGDSEHGRKLDVYLRHVRRLPLPDAILRAGYRIDGKVHDHQHLVGRTKLDRASRAILRHIDEIKRCRTLDDLLLLIGRHTEHILGFGRLAQYDFALRIGACLNMWPTAVYLHAGTKKGCGYLHLSARGKYVELAALPKPVQSLKPHHAENFLCIYKDCFSRSTAAPRSRLPNSGIC